MLMNSTLLATSFGYIDLIVNSGFPLHKNIEHNIPYF